MMKNKCRLCVGGAIILFASVFSAAGMINYPGTKLVFLLFSAMFWLLLFSALNKRVHYSYLFLAIALWLGFWLKITVHLILKLPYVEPIGNFDNSAAAWDMVLYVAIVASIGMMVSRLLFSRLNFHFSRVVEPQQAKVPEWYRARRVWIWLFALGFIVTVALVNMILGVQQGGLVHRIVLPWPLNALVAVQVSIGGSLMLAVLLWWEIAINKNISTSIYALLIEAFSSTISLLSRGVYIFHTLPQFFALIQNKHLLRDFSKVKVAALAFFFAVLMVVSIAGVTTFRAYLFPHSGGFSTEAQQHLTRSEVIESEILTTTELIRKGQHLEAHLYGLLTEKAELSKQKIMARLEVLRGGIAHVKQLILKGEPQEGHLRELLAEQALLEKRLSDDTAMSNPANELRQALAKINAQNSQARLEILNGEIAQARQLILRGDHQEELLRKLLLEQAELKKASLNVDTVVVALDSTVSAVRSQNKDSLVAPHVDFISDTKTNTATSSQSSEDLAGHKNELFNELVVQLSTEVFPRITSLIVDRWIGAEGVMAVSSYAEKSANLLIETATEKRVIGRATKYQEICNSHYRWTDASNWQFASLPGVAAFLYLSGSLWVVLIGISLFVFFMQLGEQATFAATSNPLLCSLVGLTMANTISQFGVTPRQDMPFYGLLFSFILVVYLVQSDRIARFNQNRIEA